eukprot:TRINITY_DN81378_c0_g1_i1.p1 TRINITY_DN81378_c0_g1~~TRINITY_DN81378_c0_g1_i1.p1  ORF type:complete len:651 (+),score=106.97 TRINITY_DN81378_c0_g1_i1:149-1954(+)
MDDRPVGRQTCNRRVTCPECTSRCGYGVCENYYKPGETHRARARCSCLKGYGGNNFSSALGHGMECANDLTGDCKWGSSAWSSCEVQPWSKSSTGSTTRSVSCFCPTTVLAGDGKLSEANVVEEVLEMPSELCAASSKPETEKTCSICSCDSVPTVTNGEQVYCDGLRARISCKSGFTSGDSDINCVDGSWIAPSNISCPGTPAKHRGALDSDFVVFDYRYTSAAAGTGYKTTLSACLASCKGSLDCPAFVFTPDGTIEDGGICEQLTKFSMAQEPVQRGRSHLIVRRGVLQSSKQPSLLAAAKAATTWTADLEAAVLAANEVQTKLIGTTAPDDPIWDWIANVPVEKTSQGVPFKKSLFSLAFPVHPNVVKHLRYMKRFFSADKDPHALVDWMLATAMLNRHLSSVSRSSSTGLVQEREKAPLTQECTYAGHVYAPHFKKNGENVEGQMKMPAERDANPSPLGAMNYLLRRNASLLFPVMQAPWPIMAHLPTQFFPTRECDWVWSRFESGAETPETAISKRELSTRWAFYGSGYFATDVRCKESAWHPDALPRIGEDGGLCGRLAYIGIGKGACAGLPGGMLGQPKHAAAFRFVTEADGR